MVLWLCQNGKLWQIGSSGVLDWHIFCSISGITNKMMHL